MAEKLYELTDQYRFIANALDERRMSSQWMPWRLLKQKSRTRPRTSKLIGLMRLMLGLVRDREAHQA